MGDIQILTEHAENDGYWVGVKKSPYENDEWLLNLIYQDDGVFLFAAGVTNNHFRLTTAQILELPPVADLLAACNSALEAICAGMDSWMMDELETELRSVIAKAKGDEQSTD